MTQKQRNITKMTFHSQKKGSVLILALWTVMFLTVLTVQVGMRVRRRASLIERLETNSQLRFLAQAGIKEAIAALRKDLAINGQQYTREGKAYRHNNPALFKNIRLDPGWVNVFYDAPASAYSQAQGYFGLIDEERKINLNTADVNVLNRLISEVTSLDDQDALALAAAIIDWRMPGRSTATGFYSDDFYYGLEFPYHPKDAPFERIEELYLLPGMTEPLIKQLSPFVTVYGDGRVNINTAPRQVLLALGFDEILVNKITMARRGEDDQDFTKDDYIFKKPYDLAVELLKFYDLEMAEVKLIDQLNMKGLLKTNSTFYAMKSQAKIDGKKMKYTGECVYNAHSHMIEYWREK